MICGISIWCKQTSQWVTKWDGSDNSQIEAVKGGLSGAMKRAGSQWGIGRYLYKLDSYFAVCQEQKPPHDQRDLWNQHYEKKEKKKFYWSQPELPAWALPTGEIDPVSKLKTHNAKVAEHMESIAAIKHNFDVFDLWHAADLGYLAADPIGQFIVADAAIMGGQRGVFAW